MSWGAGEGAVRREAECGAGVTGGDGHSWAMCWDSPPFNPPQLQEMSMKTTKSRVSGVLVGSRESTTLIDITGRPQSQVLAKFIQTPKGHL